MNAWILGLIACGEPVGPPLMAIEVQSAEGWSAGAAGSLDFGSTCPVPSEQLLEEYGDLRRILDDEGLRTGWDDLAVLDAAGYSGSNGGVEPFDPQPVCTGRMIEAHARGRALVELLAPATGWAIVADLPGEEAVSVAAAIATVAEPAFQLRGWPHPDGVVPTHRTLGAVLYWQEAFFNGMLIRERSPWPVFVLDADRQAPLPPDGAVFDNRYDARLPPVAALQQAGITRVLYLRPRANDTDLDDVHARLDTWQRAGIDVRLVPMQAFQPASVPDPLVPAAAGQGSPTAYYYGGTPETHWWLWRDAGLGEPPHPAVAPRDAAPTWKVDPAERPVEIVGRVRRRGERWEPVR